jgi:hypothetical protein
MKEVGWSGAGTDGGCEEGTGFGEGRARAGLVEEVDVVEDAEEDGSRVCERG